MFWGKTKYRKIEQIQKGDSKLGDNEPHIYLKELLNHGECISFPCKLNNVVTTFYQIAQETILLLRFKVCFTI